jgi:hypothetical protein
MHDSISRRTLLQGAVLAAGLGGLSRLLHAAVRKTPMTVYKDPGCGCCRQWVTLMQSAGFAVTAHDTSDLDPIKHRYRVSPALQSCHTALVEGYVVEGHVPADLIQKLLREKPKVLGLAVPGMVTGSPGMEGPNPQPYQVLSFDAAGKTTVYAKR